MNYISNVYHLTIEAIKHATCPCQRSDAIAEFTKDYSDRFFEKGQPKADLFALSYLKKIVAGLEAEIRF